MLKVKLKSGLEVPYLEKGSGIPVFLIHGFGSTHHDWNAIVDSLDKHFRVIVPNFSLQLLGELEPKPARLFTKHVQLVKEFVEELSAGAPQRYAVGHSYGGALCWGNLIENSGIFTATVLLGPMPSNPAPKIQNKTLKTLVDLARHPKLLDLYLISPLGRIHLPLIESIFHAPWIRPGKKRKFAHLTSRKTGIITQVVRNYSRIIQQEDWSYWDTRFHRIRGPLLILFGSDDHIFKEGMIVIFRQNIPQSELVMMENTGHMAMREQPHAVTQHLLKFFSRIPVQAV